MTQFDFNAAVVVLFVAAAVQFWFNCNRLERLEKRLNEESEADSDSDETSGTISR